MNKKLHLAAVISMTAVVFSGPALAKVDAAKAEALKSTLTPLGGEKAANKDGSIPAWDGGLTKAPAGFGGTGKRYVDPFPGDKPKFTITKANLDQYKDKLTPGQLAMFNKYPSYKMNVYETRRTFANPQYIYDAAFKNATTGELKGNGETLVGAITGTPFPIPNVGHEVIWNHKLRFQDTSKTRWNNQFAVTTAGDYNLVKIKEDAKFPYNYPNVTLESLNNVGIYFLQITTAPARLAGTILLVHETMDQIKEARRAWQYNPGQKRLRRAPNVGYDNPGTASDGLRTNDQLDIFNGAMDRYDWKLVGKKEMYIAYNSFLINAPLIKYKDIIRPGHINQNLSRYELHRVWIVEATLRDGLRHQFKKRRFYVDEDSWAVAVVDCYDNRDQLWKVQEAQLLTVPFVPTVTGIPEIIYDLQSGRYFVTALQNEDRISDFKIDFEDKHFAPNGLARKAQSR